MDDDAEYTLESILAEYGGDAASAAPESAPAQEDAPADDPPARGTVIPFPGAQRAGDEDVGEASEDVSGETGAEAEAGEESEANAPFDPSKPVSLQDILAQTVQEALAEREEEAILEEPPKRRGLFSRRKMRDTEQLYASEDEEEEDDEENEDPIPDLPEPPADETLAELRSQLSSATKARRAVGILTLLMWLAQLAAHFSLMPASFSRASSVSASFSTLSARRASAW